ncbi:MAG: S8 family serine peptidase, partial [Kiritimatiellae bacterium]|nr:S8 family serine peptidase [Kiritimatiellia bacterium]
MAGVAQAATVAPDLISWLNGAPADALYSQFVIVSFNTANGLDGSQVAKLRALGITKGIKLQQLGMVAVPATAGQILALASDPSVRSVWPNKKLSYFNHEARILTGVDRVQSDASITRLNGGLPVSGSGDFAVVINDSGIDATHQDLKLGTHVIQNVQILADTQTLAGFTSLLTLENVPDTDSHVGHGTHVAGIVGGTGQASGGLYAGVAPGAKLIGCGSGAGLFVLNALGGFEWSLANQGLYKIRVISNSWGSSGAFNPDDPTNIATKLAHDRNIVVVFAAGNSGPGKYTHNPYAKAPWVISVAAGTKEGGLATFSSRGTPKEERLSDSDPNNDYDAPSITAPGTGREFEANSSKFSAAIISTRATTNIVSTGLTDDVEIPPAFLPFYTQISGTSMATPHVAGVVALLLDADATLSPDEVKDILMQTASRMPGYQDFEVGAGYINVYAAVDKVFNRAKCYGTFLEPQFNVQYTVSGPTAETFHVDYSPAALPGSGSSNAINFSVQPGMSVLDVFATFDTVAGTGDGNTIGILLTDPTGAKFSSGIALPILDSPSREVVVKNPTAGQWLLEARGVRGLAALPNVSLPTSGAAAPGPVDGTITQRQFNLTPVADIQGHPAQAQIESVLKNHMMDIFSDGTFRPDINVGRDDLARLLALNTPLRQSLAASAKFVDTAADFEPIAEAVTANGATLRDWNYAPLG